MGVLLALAAMAQHRNENWVFGQDVWMKFAGDSLSWEQSSYAPSMRNATISDTAGNFLLLADDRGIHGPLFDLVEGGDSLALGWTEQSSNYIILPRPPPQIGMADRYIVVRSEATGPRRACWVEVDMEANGGLGGVVGGAHWFAMGVTARLAATPHANGSDYWVMLHEEGTDAFLAYQLTSTGIEPSPVVTHSGDALTAGTPPWHQDFLGPMKFSVQGDKLAMARMGTSQPDTPMVQLFHFDPITGYLAPWAELRLHAWYWNDALQVAMWTNARPHRIGGVDFSVSGEHLFVGTVGTDTLPEQQGSFFQFTLTGGTPEAIQGTGLYRVSQGYDWTHGIRVDTLGSILQLATDDRVYYRDVNFDNWNVYHGVFWLDSLTNDSPPTQVQFNCSGTNLYGVSNIGGFPNPCKRYHDSEPAWLGTHPTLARSAGFRVRPCPMEDVAVLEVPNSTRADALVWTDALGRIARVSSLTPNGPSMLLDRGSLPAGNYLVHVLDRGRSVGHARVMCR